MEASKYKGNASLSPIIILHANSALTFLRLRQHRDRRTGYLDHTIPQWPLADISPAYFFQREEWKKKPHIVWGRDMVQILHLASKREIFSICQHRPNTEKSQTNIEHCWISYSTCHCLHLWKTDGAFARIRVLCFIFPLHKCKWLLQAVVNWVLWIFLSLFITMSTYDNMENRSNK